MGARFRSWWQQIKKHRVAIEVVAIVLVVAITLIIVGYWFDWAGFNGYNKITVAHTISGTNAGTVIRTEEYQPGKTLWDWLQLLIVPAVLAVGGYLFTFTISRNERKAADRHNQTEREIALDNQREAALQAYIDKMSELLLNKQLADELLSNPQIESIARARTVTILRILDPVRRGSLIRFLSQAEILKMCMRYELRGIDLHGADLDDVNLRAFNLLETDLSKTSLNFANLSGALLIGADFSEALLIQADLSDAKLIEVNLSSANLTGANLSGADLRRANLSGATVTEEQLKKAKSLEGASMPDGTKHP